MEIAKIILDQLGGQVPLERLVAAYNFIKLSPNGSDILGGVAFRFKGSKKINTIRITLLSSDTYRVEFIRIWGTTMKTVKEYDDVYWDQLIDLFETTTGLYLSF